MKGQCHVVTKAKSEVAQWKAKRRRISRKPREAREKEEQILPFRFQRHRGQHLDLRLPVSRSVKETLQLFEATPVCGTLLWQPQEPGTGRCHRLILQMETLRLRAAEQRGQCFTAGVQQNQERNASTVIPQPVLRSPI